MFQLVELYNFKDIPEMTTPPFRTRCHIYAASHTFFFLYMILIAQLSHLICVVMDSMSRTEIKVQTVINYVMVLFMTYY